MDICVNFTSSPYMKHPSYTVRNAKSEEFEAVGQLMVKVYSQLEGFPQAYEQPEYYRTLTNVGDFTAKPDTELIVAVSRDGKIDGALVYFGDMQYYGSGGSATWEKNAAGFRLLAVDSARRGTGIGKLLVQACIDRAKASKRDQVIIHSTKSMLIAWKMYENFGFERSVDLDFLQGELAVFGFRLRLKTDNN
jgi:GNAT superfamily N-acetyltransferase